MDKVAVVSPTAPRWSMVQSARHNPVIFGLDLSRDSRDELRLQLLYLDWHLGNVQLLLLLLLESLLVLLLEVCNLLLDKFYDIVMTEG